MKFFKTITLFLFVLGMGVTHANDIKISNIAFDKDKGQVQFDLEWENGWKNEKNHDAAWVFAKLIFPNGSYVHGSLIDTKVIRTVSGPKGKVAMAQDKVGAFILPSEVHRGNVHLRVQLSLHKTLLRGLSDKVEVRVFGIEMVYIPEGSFFVGATEKEAVDYASFYESDDNGDPAGAFKISSEGQEIKVSPTKGNLYYKTGDSPYRGDHTGTIPTTFPKGHDAFYMMKYETTQGLYADFLNAIGPEWAHALSPHKVEGYYDKKGGIRFANEVYTADTYNRPANFITWDDGAAFADWAGLRPMTELEFTKAARGTSEPIAHEFPWGTDTTSELKRKVELNDELILEDGILEANLNDANRQVYGASYYWVMDLAGSLWEKCVTIGDEIGRNYRGTHGDGLLSANGSATNEDWPKGISEEGGYGYRGGGYYHHGMKVSDFNPHSPTAYRPYGSWAGGKPSIAYSQRYVRTAN
ncbi:MAG: hypothetical protein Aureis2KO_11350 [Aureisphaera sp.]